VTASGKPAETALAWAAGIIGHGATAVAAKGLREGNNPWLLRIEYEGRTIEAVLKTADPGDPGGFATEIAALRLADERRIPAPRILGLDATGSTAGTQAVLETVVHGRSAIPLEPTPERLRAMGAAAAALHAIAAEPSPELPVRTGPIPASDFARERRLGTNHTTPLLAAADEQIRGLPVPAGRTGFVHGDLWQGNMMWDGDTLCGLLDWDMAGVGQYGVDLCSLRLDASLMFGQHAAEPVLAGWEEASGEPAENLAYWDAVAALNQPGDMAVFTPVIHDQARHDLTAAILTERRDAFLQTALDRLY
jgi:aminoglycoside phosphotransferase (APT) family kinase protein